MSNKNFIKFFLLVLLGLLILASIFFFIDWFNKKNDPLLTNQDDKQVKDNNKQKDFQNKRMQDVSFLNEALDKNNKGICKNIKNDYTKDQCYKKIAVKQDDPDICQDIVDEKIRASCLYGIFYERALEEGNVKPCHNLTNEGAAEQCVKRASNRNFCQTEQCYNNYIEDKSIGSSSKKLNE